MPHETRTRTYRFEGRELFAYELGAGQPLLLLHGITGHAYLLEPLAEELAQDHRVIAIDQRGHGRSTTKPGLTYRGEDFAGDVLEIVGALDAGPAIVVGHSMGARNAVVAARQGPQQVAACIAVEFVPGIEDEVFDALEARIGGGLVAFGSERELEDYLRQRSARLPDDAILRRKEHGYHQAPDGTFTALADPDALRAAARGLRDDLTPAWSEVAVPVLCVRGQESAFVSEQALDKARALRDDFRCVEMSDVDHYIPEEKPRELAQIVRSFLSDVAV